MAAVREIVFIKFDDHRLSCKALVRSVIGLVFAFA